MAIGIVTSLLVSRGPDLNYEVMINEGTKCKEKLCKLGHAEMSFNNKAGSWLVLVSSPRPSYVSQSNLMCIQSRIQIRQNGVMTEWSSWEDQEALEGKEVMNFKGLTSRIWRHSFPKSWYEQMKREKKGNTSATSIWSYTSNAVPWLENCKGKYWLNQECDRCPHSFLWSWADACYQCFERQPSKRTMISEGTESSDHR